jgi:hypothetical protein
MKNIGLAVFRGVAFGCLVFGCIAVLGTASSSRVWAQGRQPYPNAVTDTLIHPETPMAPPATNVVFTDPDFGESMVRATDSTTNFKLPDTFLRTEASGEANEWSADTKKFYVLGKGGQVLVLGFDPTTMAISSLPNAGSGQALLVPIRPGPTFSFADPDLIYGTTNADQLTITSYRFSTGVSTPVIDTRTCGVQPPLGTGRSVVSDDDVSLAAGDARISISEGGPESGKDMYVIVYDQTLGCRWYNTQTGQIGGQWGAVGNANVNGYLIRHAYLSRSGNYVHILTDVGVSYQWDVATLNLSACAIGSGLDCAGYGIEGYDTYVNAPGVLDDMQMVKRPLSDLSQITELIYPLPSPAYWGQVQHLTWSNVDANDSTPVCGSNYSYYGDPINQPFAAEIFCVETDGLASTVWRFAHNRATYVWDSFQTQPLGNVSLDGGFFLFTSDWDSQLGLGSDWQPRTDVFIVKLD